MRTKIAPRLTVLFLVALICGGSSDVFGQRKKKAPPRYTVSANSLMRLRLNEGLNSKKANVGDQFRSTVADPVYARGFQVIPPGSFG